MTIGIHGKMAQVKVCRNMLPPYPPCPFDEGYRIKQMAILSYTLGLQVPPQKAIPWGYSVHCTLLSSVTLPPLPGTEFHPLSDVAWS